VPARLRNQWENEREAWMRVHAKPWNADTECEYHHRFSGAIEQWLDAGRGTCLLRRADCAGIVADTLRHFEGHRVVMLSFAVMPNHVHALFVQNPMWPLEKLIQSWKRLLRARSINYWNDRAVCGSAITLIGLSATRSILRIAFVTSGGILPKSRLNLKGIRSMGER
jgi:hypothetical protein